MAMYPQVPETQSSLLTTQNFYGLDYRAKIPDGSWCAMGDLTSDEAPMLSSRNPRYTIVSENSMSGPTGAVGMSNAFAYIDHGTLYWQYQPTRLTGLNYIGDEEVPAHQLVVMGGYILIFPNNKYYNTLDGDGLDYGDMGADWTCHQRMVSPASPGDNCVYCVPCDLDGVPYEITSVGTEEPEEPGNGDVWIDTSNPTHTLSVYSSTQKQWVEVPTVYTKVVFSWTRGANADQFASLFSESDVVTVSGFGESPWTGMESFVDQVKDLNGEKELIRCGTEDATYTSGGTVTTIHRAYCILIGILDGVYRQNGQITLKRVIPSMNYVCEAQNRLWGCFYGLSDDGKSIINEIYASALGDFRNWRKYRGISTDSWAASVGSPGVWTGAVNYLGRPLFFKEDRIHQVTPSDVGAHAITETVCRGIEQGSWRSAVVVDETLYYKSPFDICMYQGALPKGISENFGTRVFHNAVAGGCGGKYYISMQNAASSDDNNDHYSLFVYDTRNGLWHREDDTMALAFADVHNDLVYLDQYRDSEGGIHYRVISELGKITPPTDVHIPETLLSWYCVSGFQNWQVTTRMYVSRYVFRLALEEGATFRLQVRYDAKTPLESERTCPWIDMGTISDRRTTESFLFPVRPRRCDHLQFRLSGTGKFRLYSMTRYLETGSDLQGWGVSWNG